MISVVIVCAGKGTRMNVNTNKILLPLEGKPIFMHSVDKFKKYTNDITVNHYPDNSKSRSSYLPLLELSVKENPNNDRNMHYLGRE